MAKIKVMDSHLANMIAAGEVIERPSSVVKELVENSIDANSKHIEVYVYEAGRKRIIVKDDGHGMEKEDAMIAFKRHASSKLLNDRDLFRIKTMGFRGEALPSISSVSKVTMETSTGESVGTKITIEEDEMKVEECSMRKGTQFTVEELFYNTPVRLKFLKMDTTENANTLEVMQRLALSRPDISFDFYIDNRLVFKTTGRGDLLEVIARIYSNDTAKKMMSVNYENYEFKVTGYIGKPELNKSNRYFMITILNDRSVYLPKVQKAIMEAYSDFIFNSRYPFVILKIDVEHSLVDVNVHPSKREVRLSNEERITDCIYNLIRDQLLEKKPLTESNIFRNEIKKEEVLKDENVYIKEQEKISLLLDEDEEKEVAEVIRPTLTKQVVTPSVDLSSFDEKVVVNKEKEEIKVEVKENKFKAPLLIPLCQIHETYIVCQGEDGFYLIDQHAAQERVNYEKLTKELNSEIKVCDLLVPLVMNINPTEMLRLKDKIHLLNQIGISIEPFGLNTIKIDSIPLFVKESNEEVYIEELITQVISKDKIDLDSLRKHVISTFACKASIKANHKLSLKEMEDVIKSLFACDNPTCCPHGRPTIVHFSKYDIEKMFKRSGI